MERAVGDCGQVTVVGRNEDPGLVRRSSQCKLVVFFISFRNLVAQNCISKILAEDRLVFHLLQTEHLTRWEDLNRIEGVY